MLLRRDGRALGIFAAREKHAPRINSGLHQYISRPQVEVPGLLKGSHIGLPVKRWLAALERRGCATLPGPIGGSESHGLKVVAKSDILRKPDDARDQFTYKGPMVGKTDRFVLVFRKPAP